jgi:hypothetical protein
MRYKALVTTKLEALDNSISGIVSLLSQPNFTREQLEDWRRKVKEKISDIQTLVNSEQESF